MKGMIGQFLLLLLLIFFAIIGNKTWPGQTETGESGLFTMPTTEVLSPGNVRMGLHGNVEAESDPGTRDTDLHLGHFSIGAGILRNFEAALRLSYFSFEQMNWADRGVGQARLAGKYRLFEEDQGSSLSFGVLAGVAVGTGRNRSPLTLDRTMTLQGGQVQGEVMGLVDKNLFSLVKGAPAVLSLNAGALFMDSPPFNLTNQSYEVQKKLQGKSDFDFGPAFQYGLGIKVPVYRRGEEGLDLMSEIKGNTGVISQLNKGPVSALAGARYATGTGLSIGFGADLGLTSLTDDYRILGSLTYKWPRPEPLKPPVVEKPVERIVERVVEKPVGRIVEKEVPVEQVVTGEVPKIVAVERIVFSDVAFEFDSTVLTPVGKGRVYLVAQKLKENKNVKVVVEGHTDFIGTTEYNQGLGLKRANAVKEELRKLGISSDRMTTASYGESKPLLDMKTGWARAVNRRVEFEISGEAPTGQK